MPSFEKRFKVREPTSIFKQEDKKSIHEGALHIMERTGIRIPCSRARSDLQKAGALVDDKSMVVRFPKEVVLSLIKSVPSTIVLAGRTKEFDLPVDGTHHYYTTDGCGISVWDEKTKTKRNSTLADITRTAVIGDWLPYVSIYEPMVVANDVPAEKHVVMGMREALKNTQKHIETESTTKPEEARAQVRMAAEVVGGTEELRNRHYISAMVCTTAPLQLEELATEDALVWAENHVPVHITAMGQMGLTGPATVVGDLVICHAETLALAAVMQAHERGAPLLYGSVLSSMDPKTGAVNFGSPETMMLAAGSSEMARYVKWPCSCGGIGPGAAVPGVQASVENSTMALLCAMTGSEIMNGVGLVDNSTVLSYEQLMIDNDIVGLTIAACKDIPADTDALALDIIEKVGIGGTYLAEMHTLRHAREFYAPLIWSKDSYDSWVKRGRKDVMQVAKEKADSILKEHRPVPLDNDVSRGIDAIVEGFK
jgi:trimethylamine--corrinoid protein Co-methyltransferase